MKHYLCESCPSCGESNLVRLSDSPDPSVTDPEGCKCWSCGHIWVWDLHIFKDFHPNFENMTLEEFLEQESVEIADGLKQTK